MDHGNEQPALIAAYLLDGEGGGRRMDWAAIRAWTPEQGLLWVHLDYTTAQAQDWLRRESGLDEVVAEALLADETRPRSEVMDSGLLVILRGVNTNPGADPEDMVSLRIWLGGGRIITTRRYRLLSVRDMQEAVEAGRGPRNEGEFVVRVADRLVARMSSVIVDIDDMVADLEEQVLSADSHTLRLRLAAVRREAIILRRYMAPLREALSRLQVDSTARFSDMDRLRLREVSDKVTRFVEELDAVRERAAVISDELASRQSETMNRRMYVLSLAAAVFLPLGFLTGLLGINVGGIPGADDPWAFLEVTIVLALLVAVQLMVFWRKRWL